MNAIVARAPLRKDVSYSLQGGGYIATLSVEPTADISTDNLAASFVTADTVTKRLAHEVTVDCDLAVGAASWVTQ